MKLNMSVISPVRFAFCTALLLMLHVSATAQYLWSVQPGSIIPVENNADHLLLVENSPTANFNIDFDTGGTPRLVGNDIQNTITAGFDFSFERSGITGGFSLYYEADYRVYLLPTNNPDVWIVAMDWTTKTSFLWSRSGTLYLWKVNKNNPPMPISTSAQDVQPPPALDSDTSGSYDDGDWNGWDDGMDISFWNDWDDVPEGSVTIGPLIPIESWSENDYDGWFEEDNILSDWLEEEVYDYWYDVWNT
jgi:hypothetical protein